MKTTKLFTSLTLVFILLYLSPNQTLASNINFETQESCKINNENKLVVVWSSDDPMVAKRIALMYPHAALKNKWFDEVTLVIWGPSAKVISENIELQKKLSQMKEDGVEIKACIACSNEYGVTEILTNLGYEVIPMGVPLSEYLKKGYKVLTF